MEARYPICKVKQNNFSAQPSQTTMVEQFLEPLGNTCMHTLAAGDLFTPNLPEKKKFGEATDREKPSDGLA